mmetsp:Transcript_26012/g.66177  ORF Transcript_26012/g.66177 Transcript_26012/m.66177 type:complete len:91 (+) Transcript_26012:790-1062(+)
MGMDAGDVAARLSPATGRMTYSGKCMNRAARIAGMANTSQVLCSKGVWTASRNDPEIQSMGIAGVSLGMQELKGTRVEVIHCTLMDQIMG